MTIVPHAIIGASAALFTGNIYIAFLFGLISHFVADATPHLEPNSLVKYAPDGTKKWSPWLYVFVASEFILTILIFYFLRTRPDFYLLVVAGIGGLLPDIIVNNPFLQKYRYSPVIKYIFWFHDKIHLELPIKYWYISAICEIALIGLAIWLLVQ